MALATVKQYIAEPGRTISRLRSASGEATLNGEPAPSQSNGKGSRALVLIPCFSRGQDVSHPSSERVLVVPGSELDRLGRFQGFHADAERYLSALLVPELMEYRPRSEVEDDPSLKQIIPYVVLRCGDAVFCYTRGKSQGEARLHRRRSLGVGGHVAESDAEGRRSFRGLRDGHEARARRGGRGRKPGPDAAGRPDQRRLHPRGLGPPGRRSPLDLEHPAVRPREDGLAEPEFVRIALLHDFWDEFETWSQICIDAFLRAR